MNAQDIAFAEVKFYFQVTTVQWEDITLALVSLYSSPSQQLLDESYNTLVSCLSQGDAGLRVIPVKSIIAVVGMVPHTPFGPGTATKHFVVEKPGLDVAVLGGAIEEVPDE